MDIQYGDGLIVDPIGVVDYHLNARHVRVPELGILEDFPSGLSDRRPALPSRAQLGLKLRFPRHPFSHNQHCPTA